VLARWRLGLVVLASCAESPPSAPTNMLDLDVVLHRDRVEVYTNTSDIPCECKETDARFPALGTCLVLDDTIDACSCGSWGSSSCITEMRVVGAEGTVILNRHIDDEYTGDLTGLTEPTLFIVGCTPDDIEVPLAWSPVETPTLTNRYRMHQFDVSWSGTEAIALVEGGWAFVGARCVTTETVQTLPSPIFVPSFLWTTLSMLEPPHSISNAGADVRIWSASDTVGHTFAPCRDDDTLCWLGNDQGIQ
jgi:hypothetical protein